MLSWIAASVSDAGTVAPNGIITLWGSYMSRFFINGKPTLINGLRSLPRNPPDWTILDSLIIDNFIVADEFLAKVQQSYKLFSVGE